MKVQMITHITNGGRTTNTYLFEETPTITQEEAISFLRDHYDPSDLLEWVGVTQHNIAPFPINEEVE